MYLLYWNTLCKDGCRRMSPIVKPHPLISAVFQEASVTLASRKIYWQDMDKANQSPEIAKRIYGFVPVHRMFIRGVEYTI